MSAMSEKLIRDNTEEAVLEAAQAWEAAPIHIKAMAGAYVGPILKAIRAINDELRDLKK